MSRANRQKFIKFFFITKQRDNACLLYTSRIDTLENNFKQALHKQVVRIENKQKELRLEWRKDIKEAHKQINDNLNDTLTTITREQDDKIQTVNNMSQANTSKIREIETRTVVIENRIEETTKDRSGDVSHMKEEIQEEMNQLRSELRRRQNQMTMFPTPMDDGSRLKISGGKGENSMESVSYTHLLQAYMSTIL